MHDAYRGSVDNQAEVRDFLRTRRDRITPDQAGIIGGGKRRVPGLRRDEVAVLAGMSVDYYARMERGNLSGVSAEILDGLARALMLDDTETEHLHDLAAAAQPSDGNRRKKHAGSTISPALQRFIDAADTIPTWVRNRRSDFVATNTLARAVFSPILDDRANQRNNARFTFLSPAARTYYPDWEQNATSMVAALRMSAGQHPRDRELTDLIGELVTRSDTFRTKWAAHDVRHHRAGTKRIQHPIVGELVFHYEGMELSDYPGHTLYAYVPENTDTERRLVSLMAPGDSALEIEVATGRRSPMS